MRGMILGVVAACLFVFPAAAWAIGQAPYVESVGAPGSFPIVQPEGTKVLYVEPEDWPGVLRVVNDLQSDIARVTGHRATISHEATGLKGNVIIVGTIGKSKLIGDLATAGKINTRATASKWESFFLQVVPEALPDVAAALVIAGSDKRGTIYGVYDLSEQMGVSPWYWWADVPIQHKDALYVKVSKYEQGEPSVRYRGIFLNDEAPDLSGWVAEKFGTVRPRPDPPVPPGVANYNSAFYARIFEVILAYCAKTHPGPIGFVLPKPIACVIYHYPFCARHLPLPLLWRKLALFRTNTHHRGTETTETEPGRLLQRTWDYLSAISASLW
jgi:hypothetical protein